MESGFLWGKKNRRQVSGFGVGTVGAVDEREKVSKANGFGLDRGSGVWCNRYRSNQVFRGLKEKYILLFIYLFNL